MRRDVRCCERFMPALVGEMDVPQKSGSLKPREGLRVAADDAKAARKVASEAKKDKIQIRHEANRLGPMCQCGALKRVEEA